MNGLLLKLPMPGTSNHQYVPVNGRLIKSSESRNYSKQIEIIKLRLHKQLDEFKSLLKKDTVLKVDVYTVFPKKKFFTKDKSLRKFDHGNRLKPILDSVALLLNHDDSMFIDGRLVKTYHDDDFEIVYVSISILPEPIPFEAVGIR